MTTISSFSFHFTSFFLKPYFCFPHFTHCYLNIFHLYFLLRLPWPWVAKYLFLKLKINLFFSEESGYKSTSMLSLLSDELQVLNSDITFIFIAIIFSVLVCFNLSYFFKVGFCFLNRIQFYDSFAPYTQYVAFVYFSSFILISQCTMPALIVFLKKKYS